MIERLRERHPWRHPVDHVQPRRTEAAVAHQQLVRLVLVAGLCREVSLEQSNSAAVA